jgi:propanol-preferring alcohol dehydrogenase
MAYHHSDSTPVLMFAMRIHRIARISDPVEPLSPDQVPASNEVLIKIDACGVCHTELDEIEGRTPPPSFPVTPGHQVVG